MRFKLATLSAVTLLVVACEEPASSPPEVKTTASPILAAADLPASAPADAASQPASAPSGAITASAAMPAAVVPAAAVGVQLTGYQAFGPPWAKKLPAWAKAPPHIADIDGEPHFVAVGRAKVKNQALAHLTAGNRARADILRYAMGSTEDYVEGKVRGSRIVKTFKARDGFYYIEVCAPVAQNR